MNLCVCFGLVLLSFLIKSNALKNSVLDLIKGKKASRSDALQIFRNYYKYNYYMTLEEMETRMLLLQLLYPNKIAVEIIGQSSENRDIHMFIITDNALEWKLQSLEGVSNLNKISSNNSTAQTKPVIFIDAAMHAREWVAPAAAFYVIDELLKSPYLTNQLEWRIVPMANPDGYEFTHNYMRYWRKNRCSTSRNCIGVDLNRNFDFLFQSNFQTLLFKEFFQGIQEFVWYENKRSTSSCTNAVPCSEVYGGEYPFSEPETRAIRDAVTNVAKRAEAYISLHAFGQWILYPNGVTRDASEKLVKMARGIAKRLDLYHGTYYQVAQTFVPGASSEWAFANMNIPYSFTFELQPHSIRLLGSSGFQLSEWKLRNAVHECWAAVQYLAEEILLENKAPLGSDINKLITEQIESTTDDILNQINLIDIVKAVKRLRSVLSADNDKHCIKKEDISYCPLMLFSNSEFEKIIETYL